MDSWNHGTSESCLILKQDVRFRPYKTRSQAILFVRVGYERRDAGSRCGAGEALIDGSGTFYLHFFNLSLTSACGPQSQ